MILAVGMDFVEITRLEEAARRHPRLLQRLFTDGERAFCLPRARPGECLSARFAAKEAALKAIGTGWGRGVGWRDVEVTGGGNTPPSLLLHGEAEKRYHEMGGTGMHLSLTHGRTVAGAVVILEGDSPR